MGNQRGQQRSRMGGRGRTASGSGSNSGGRGSKPMARLLALSAIGICLVAALAIVAGSGGDADTGRQSTLERTENSDRQKAAKEQQEPTPKTTKAVYVVRAGDSFALIAEEVGISVDQLQELNPDIDPRALQPGQKLKLR